MANSQIKSWETSFNRICDRLFTQLESQSQQYLIVQLRAENSHFLRLNNAKVRQTGIVIDGEVSLKFIANKRTNSANFPLTGDVEVDLETAIDNLDYLRSQINDLPEDAYIVLPENQGTSHEVYTAELLSPELAVEAIVTPTQGIDFTGLYASGTIVRANYNNLGQKHWFATDSFFVDYSLINSDNKAIKGIFSAKDWDSNAYQKQITDNQKKLQQLELPTKEIKPGNYRTYLAPAAVADLLGMFSWGGISEASMQQGASALAKLRQGKTLSSLFDLKENFTSGNVPQFNDLGQMSADELPLIVNGELVNTLISSRTAIEYGLISNYASGYEGLRSPEIGNGKLTQAEILANIGTGLYLSNLHYLNWSDRSLGRITGMTRYGCFWVEDGKIVATIKDLRFDDSLYSFFGDNLLALTDFREFIPNTGTYESRSLGGVLIPGALVDNFTFTL